MLLIKVHPALADTRKQNANTEKIRVAILPMFRVQVHILRSGTTCVNLPEWSKGFGLGPNVQSHAWVQTPQLTFFFYFLFIFFFNHLVFGFSEFLMIGDTNY